MKGPHLTNTQSRGMRNGTTRYATYTSCLVKEPRGYATASGERARLMAGDKPFSEDRRDFGTSPVIAEILFVAITVLLAALLTASLSGSITFPVFEKLGADDSVPEILQIVSISHVSNKNESGIMSFAGIVKLQNVGNASLETRSHGLYLYVDDRKTEAVVETLNSHDFISTEHTGVHTLEGEGPLGDFWEPAYFGTLDFLDNLIVSGSLVRIDVYEKETGKIISRSEMYAPTVFFG